jgi:CBS domain-containing protein
MLLRELPVRDLMVRDVLTFASEQNVHEAMRALVERSVGGAPVVDADGRVVGVLSVSDLIVPEARLHFPTIVNLFGVNVALPWHDKELDESVSKALGEFVGEVMTAPPVTVATDATIEDVATLMHDRQVPRLPVVDAQSRLAGIITRTDILRAMVRGLDQPDVYDTVERLGESGADVDAAARAHHAAKQAAREGRTSLGSGAAVSSEQAHADEQDFGIDVGRI